VLFNFYEKDTEMIDFKAQVGMFHIQKNKATSVMNFLAYHCNPVPVTDTMKDAIGADVLDAYLDKDLLLVLEDENTVINLKPDQKKMEQLDEVTAKGTAYDCVSRIFAPKMGVPEDSVTGSTHCMITPYWCKKLGKNQLTCYQTSE
jgi:predicted PhzF superfamily epimerase YddE/YHI9